MASVLKIEHKCAAPPERVFAVATDFANMTDHLSGVTKVEMLTGGPVAVGTRFRETRVMFGKEATEEMTVTALQPPRSYTMEALSCGVHYKSILDFLPDGGGTRIVMTITATPQTVMTKITGPLMGFLMKGAMKKAMLKDFADLDAAASQPATSA